MLVLCGTEKVISGQFISQLARSPGGRGKEDLSRDLSETGLSSHPRSKVTRKIRRLMKLRFVREGRSATERERKREREREREGGEETMKRIKRSKQPRARKRERKRSAARLTRVIFCALIVRHSKFLIRRISDRSSVLERRWVCGSMYASNGKEG